MPRHPNSDTLSRATSWPPEAKAELAAYAAEIEVALAASEYHPTNIELAGINRRLADANEGRFATNEEVAAVFARYRGA